MDSWCMTQMIFSDGVIAPAITSIYIPVYYRFAIIFKGYLYK
jgi:hypothetical protein